MADDIATLGFKVNTGSLTKGERALDDFARTGERTERRVDKSSREMSSSFGLITKAIGLVAASLVGLNKLVDISREFDILNAQLITATGSSERAAIAFQAIQDFAARTPFDLAQVTDSFVKLVNLGLTPSERALEAYGNTASAMGRSLNQLIEAVADAATGEFERLKEFGIKTKSEGDNVVFTFRGIATTVKKEAAAIEGFLLALGENEFAGAMANRVDTLDGAISNLGDSWNKLFLTVSKAGVSGLIEDQVRGAIIALDDLSDFIESGQLQASIDLIGDKFSIFGDDIDKMLEGTTDSFIRDAGFWVDVIDNFVALAKDSFFNFPENMRAAIQLTGVELAAIVTLAETHFSAFGQIIGIKLGELVEKTKVFGRQLAIDFNPFSDDSFDFEGELQRLTELSEGMINDILANAERSAEAQTQLRRDAIIQILEERNAAVESSDTQIKSIMQLGAEFKKLRKERAEASGDALAQFKLINKESEKGSKITSKQIRDFEKLTKSVDKFGGAWSRTGSIIVDAFGDMADALNDYILRIKDIEKLEEQVAAARITFGDDNSEVIQLQAKLDSERVSAELAGLKAVASATGSLFDEKTGAAKAFAALSKIITVAEIALSFQKIAASNAETISHVANETVKQGSNSLTAITAAFAAPWPIGFIAGAAMIGIMASLLGGSSGSSSGDGSTPESAVADQPEASSSITDASDRILEIQIDQLAELKGIRDGLTSVQIGSSQLARLLSGGGASSAQTALKLASIVELKVLQGSPLEGQIEDLIADAMEFALSSETVLRSISDGISNTFKSAIDILGVDISGSLDGFLLNIDDVDIAGLTLEEITDKLSGAFSDQSDVLVGLLVPAVSDYQKANEGLFDTLVRVSQEQAIFNDAIDQIGISLTSLSSIMKVDIAQSVIGLIGGLEIFSDLTSEFFSEFFSEEEQFEQLSKALNEAVQTLGISMFDSRNQFRAMIEGIDLTTLAGQRLFAGLLELVPAFDDFFDSVEESARASTKLAEAERRSALDSVKASFTMIQKSIDLEKQRARAILDVASEAHTAELNRIEGLRIALEAENEIRKRNALDAKAALNSAFDAEMKRIQDRSQGEIDSIQERTSIEAKLIQEASSIRIKGLNSEKSAINATAKAMRSLVQRINLSLGLSGGQDLISALAGARAGDFAKAQALDVNALANLDPSQFASAEEFRIAQARNRNRLATIGMLAGTELSEADRQLQGIESQINSSKTNSDMQIAAIKDQSIEEIEAIRTQTERQVQELQEQLNVLLGVDTSVLSIEEAITKFRDAQITLQELNFEKEIGLLDMLTVSAEEVFTLHEQGYADELERLDQILIDNQALLDVALGIDNNILLVSEAITSLNSSIVALAERPATVVVIPAAPASLANMATSSEPATVQATQEVKNELIKMREDNMLVQREIVKNTKSTALILQRFELDGLDTRQIQ